MDAVYVPDLAGRACRVVNPELYEAASLDGAGWWQALRDITLPGLARVIAVAILFRALDAFKIFDLVYMFTQGEPGTSTETISWYIYQVGFKFFRLGYASAVSYLLLIFLTVVATLYAGRFLSEERRERSCNRTVRLSRRNGAPNGEDHAHPPSPRRHSTSRFVTQWSVLALLFCLFPIVWVVGVSVKFPADYLRNPPVWIPREVTGLHYQSVMSEQGNLALKNSLIIAGSATLLSMLIGSLAAYSLARFNTGGRHFGFWLLSQRMMPPVVLVVPFFLLLREAGEDQPTTWDLTRTLPLIALYTVFNLPFVIWMMRSYFSSVPVEIEESALVDGATRLRALASITLPLALPGLIATTVLSPSSLAGWSSSSRSSSPGPRRSPCRSPSPVSPVLRVPTGGRRLRSPVVATAPSLCWRCWCSGISCAG